VNLFFLKSPVYVSKSYFAGEKKLPVFAPHESLYVAKIYSPGYNNNLPEPAIFIKEPPMN